MLRQALLLMHLLAAIAWIGGMFFAYFCLRPSAAEGLPPAQRLPLWLATLTRFLRVAGVAVGLLLASGLTMLLQTGLRAAPIGWHAMLGLGIVMAVVYALAHARWLPRLRARCAAADWPAAAQALDAIRRLVALNLVLGVLVVLAAVSAR
ncbi:MAG: CopD family protein [Ideonella sp.]|nr:CopD family protein [Ideonella sp.]